MEFSRREQQMNKIKITLKSDLCAASGDGFSSSIDTDVCIDRYGLPFVPSRRLKGCLREAAEYIELDRDVVNSIFGVTGSDKPGSLKISDALLEDYGMLSKEADCLIHANKIHGAEITKFFTSVKAETKIDSSSGAAEDNSLRFTRTVNHYLPKINKGDEDKETVFIADIEIDDKYTTDFMKICKALKNIGYKRNRGYGAVKCELIKSDCANRTVLISTGDILDNETYTIGYTVILNDNVFIPSATADSSYDYIPGSTVLGAFAGKYLSINNEDGNFENLFLKNNICFSPLYITKKENEYSIPAVPLLGRIKGEDGVFNVTERTDDKIIKPFKNGYLTERYEYIKPVTETIYHHSTSEKVLYTQNCISKGQLFSGTISGKGIYLKSILNLLNGSIRFGRSKTAQYSLCDIISSEIISKDKNNEVKLEKGEYYAAVALSDIVLMDEFGNYNPSYELLKEKLGEKSELFCFKPGSNDDKMSFSTIRYKAIMGYNAKRGLQSPHYRVIAAGSAVVFKAADTGNISKNILIGEKFGEGFGHIAIYKLSEFKCSSTSNDKLSAKDLPVKGLISQLLDNKLAYEDMRNEAIDFVKNHIEELKELNASTVGRLILMAKQSKVRSDFENRYKSIKTESKINTVKSILEKADVKRNKLKDSNLWRNYVLIILNLTKYKLKENKKEDSNHD